MQTLFEGEKQMDEKEKTTEINLPTDFGNVSEDIQNTGKKRRKNYTVLNNKFFTQDLIDTPIYNEELMENVLVGIAQNIWLEMDRQGLSIRGLAEMSSVNYSQLTKIFNNKGHIGLTSMIKIAAALHVSPSELFPYDQNRRKTNGQRFDEITKGMDLASTNYLLDVCAGYSKVYLRHHK